MSPSDYSLFQAADMFCTLAILEGKLESDGLSNSEQGVLHESERPEKELFETRPHEKAFPVGVRPITDLHG